MWHGLPDALLRARDLQDIRQALQFCFRNKIPVTFCGSQTSMTGASVANGGLLISTEKLEKVLDIDVTHGRATAKAEPGVTIAALKNAVSLGGGVAGEHGIGKLHRDLVPIQWSTKKIERMRTIKQEWDPHWLLGRGNILEW